MKKYIVIIILIGIILGGILFYNVIKVEEKSNLEFSDSGYILQNFGTQNVERYYFNADEKYKTKYEQKVIFNNTEGEQITTEKNNFIHYSNGSISSFTNGVILGLNEIDKDPIQYYNISASSILTKEKEYYTINNLGETLKFTDIIWKIDSNKYIILSNNIILTLNETETKEINGYIELEYLDNEIVKIYNQETTYQTISSRANIELPNNIKITLSSKIVSKNNENKMSLENMIIDSDDNITIVDLTQKDEEEDTTNSTQGGQGIMNNGGQSSSGDGNNSSQTIINGGGTQTPIGGNGDSNINGNNPSPVQVTQAPKFKVENFEVTSIGFSAIIGVEDNDGTLVEDSNIYILENTTGKKVYQYVEALGVYRIDLSVSTLEPNTEYTLVLESAYAIDGITYTKNFIYKIFRTSIIGIEIEKDVFTDTSLGVALIVNKDTKAKSIDVVLSDINGEVLQTQTVEIEKDDTSDTRKLVEFPNLTSNTDYIVSLTNILYDGQILTNGYIEAKTYKTLKSKPTISGTVYEINKRDSNFVLKLTNLRDIDGGIQKYIFKIYDTRIVENNEPVKIIESISPTITLDLDEETIVRNVGYTFKVVTEFYDNEKIYEYESEYSNVMKMDGVEFPGVRFEEDEVTFERIKGTIIIDDAGKTIDIEENEFAVIYTDSTGNMQTFNSSGSYNIPVDVNNLRANETYRFAIYATIDLRDGNDPIDECYIGGFVVQTKIPQNMVAKFSENEGDVENTFSVNLNLQKEKEDQGTLEPETLTGMTISIYAGQTLEGEYPTGTPLRTMKLVDNNTEPYESELKTQFFDNKGKITPAFFNASNDDFKDAYYTITITNSYDYTQYKNALPIISNVFTIETNGHMPDLPTNPDNALTVTALRNYTQENPRADLSASTIVGYSVKANYDNSGLYAKKVIYKAYDVDKKILIETKELDIGDEGIIPEVTFDVLDGTDINVQDTDCLRRGNSYYFTYEMLLDLNNDGIPETTYPYKENVVLKSGTQKTQKQEPNIYIYPKISTKNSITFKYKFNDIDNAVCNENQVIAKISNAITLPKNLVETGDEFAEVTFENLRRGKLTLMISKCLVKNEGLSDDVFLTQYFESENSLDGLVYNISYDSNKLSINFNEGAKALSYITGVRIELVSESDENIKYIKDFQEIPSNNIISINYNELGVLLKTTAKVNVYVYYDSGIVGYETDPQKFVTYQKAYEDEDDEIYYYDINKDLNLIQDTETMGNMYLASRNDNTITMQNTMTNRSTTVELTPSKEGFLYQGNVVLQKQVDEAKVICVNNDTIYFDLIIPGITLKDENDEWQIVTELDNVSIKAVVLVDPSTNIVDDKIYVDLYQTDRQYKEENFVRTIEVGIDQLDQPISITNLQPQSYYFVKFRTMVMDESGTQSEIYLYDLNYQVSGRAYYFSTLAEVGIDKIQIIYDPVKYEEKYINISYALEKITGYDRIEYKIYHYNDQTMEYEEIMQGISIDQIFYKEMNKKISIEPGSEFIFGDKYKLEIIPIAEYTDLEGRTSILELGKQEKEFKFKQLQSPTIAITGNRRENNKIAFKTTIYDDNRVIVKNEYSIKIYNAQMEDITPDKYKEKNFSVDTINNTIIIDDVKSDQSYTILVIAKLDKNNSNLEEEYTNYTKQYTIPAINEYGISIGELTITKNSQDPLKVDIIFSNSYKLNEIDSIMYSIYNTSGYSRTGQTEFIPTQITSGEENYYTYTIDERLTEKGKYYIEIQFIKNNQVVENTTLEYLNI